MAQQTRSHFIPVDVKGLMVDPVSNVPILILRSDEDPSMFLPIWIGVFEANAIALRLESVEAPRPLTHDLSLKAIESCGFLLKAITIHTLKEGTFFADLVLTDAEGTGERTVDARPSDAVALALRAGAAILVAREVFEEARAGDITERFQQEERLKKWLEEIDPEEPGKYTM